MKAKLNNIFAILLIVLAGVVQPAFSNPKENELFSIAVSSFCDEFYEVSISLFKRFIKDFPNSPAIDEAKLYIAKSYYYKKDYNLAMEVLIEIIDNYPKSKFKDEIYYLTARVYFYLAESYYMNAELDKAIENYRLALAMSYDLDAVKNLIPDEIGLQDLIYQGLAFSHIAKGESLKAQDNINNIKDKELFLFSQGILSLKTRNYIRGLKMFNIFIKKYPESRFLAQAYLNKAGLLYDMGRLNDSIYTYRYILSNFTASEYNDIIDNAHYGLAWCYLKSAKFKKAIFEFKNTLEHTDNIMVALSSQIQIADSLKEQGAYEEALNIYKNILSKYPDAIYADYISFQIGMSFLKKNELKEAVDSFKGFKNTFPSSKLMSQAQYYLALAYFSQENYNKSKALLGDFISKFKDDELIFNAHYLYGKCLINEANYKQALSVFKKILAKSKNKDIQELSVIDIGNIYFNLSLFDKAKKVWEEFLEKFSSSQYITLVALSLGGLCENQGNYIEAKKYYEKAINASGKSQQAEEALVSLGYLYLEEDDLETAQDYLKKLVDKKAPLALKGKFYLAKTFAESMQTEKALALYEELINSKTSISKEAILSKAFLLKEMKDYHRAIAAFKEAIHAGSDSRELRFSLGFCLEKVGQGEQAVKEYFKIIESFYDEESESLKIDSKGYEIKSYFRIAKIYERQGNKKKAKEVYERIVNLNVEEAKIAQMRLEELEKH